MNGQQETMPSDGVAVRNGDFLRTIRGELGEGEHLWVAHFPQSPDIAGPAWAGRSIQPGKPMPGIPDTENTYFSVAVLRGGKRDARHFVRLMVLVADDAARAVCQRDPSWVLRTSEGSRQVGFILRADDPATRDADQVRRALAAVAALGDGKADKNGNSLVRYVRLPVGTNTKREKPFRHVLTEWRPDAKFTLAEALAALGIVLCDETAAPATEPVSSPPPGTHALATLVGAMQALDPGMGRDTWLHVGMALHYEAAGGVDARDAWDAWSSGGANYVGRDDLDARWQSFGKAARQASITGGTLLKMAKEAGWVETLSDDFAALIENAAATPTTSAELIARLATLDDLAYYQVKTASAKALGITGGNLDKLVNKERSRLAAEAESTSEGGSFVLFDEADPWPEAVDGAALLDHMTATIRRFTVLSVEQARACALWAAFTWFIDGANVAPLLNVTSPEPRCGKTTLGELVKEMVARPLYASNITPAALFRAVEKWKPTLLIDETDAFLNEKEELRGIINAGHYRSTAYVIRVVGEALEPKQFCTWGAKALIGIGKIAHTLTDRSIVIELRRKLETERVEKVRHAEPDLFDTIRRKLVRWADDELASYRVLRPEPIQAIHDRAADNWEPLLAVAMLAGGEWPARCRRAALSLSGAAQEAPSINAELLADIKAVFERKGASKLFTTALLWELCEDTEAPWATWNHGKPMSARQLSSRLSSFGVASGTIRIGADTAKGYVQEKFADAFARYLPEAQSESVTPSQPSNGGASGCFPIRHTATFVTDEKARKPSNGAGCDVVTDESPFSGQIAAESDVAAWGVGVG